MFHDSHVPVPRVLSRTITTALLILVVMAGLLPGSALARSAATLPAADDTPPQANIDLTLIASGLSRPVYVISAPADRARLFIVEKPGRIRIHKNNALLPTPFIDIDPVVRSSGNEEGLLSMAFHPAYASNGYFYVYYTNNAGDLEIARYSVTANPDVADPNSARWLPVSGNG